MGKESRRASRRARHDRKSRSRPLRAAIVTSPSSMGNGPSLTADVELVRAAVLYADEVQLVSMSAVMLASVVQFAAGDGVDMLGMLSQLDDATLTSLGFDAGRRRQLVASLPLLRSSAFDDLGIGDARREILQGLEEPMMQMREIAAGLLESSGGVELIPALESGVVTLSPSGLEGQGATTDDAVENWLRLLKRLVHDPEMRLLFDDGVADLVRALVREGTVRPRELTLQHAGQAAIGAGLIARLPVFPQARLDELLDLRADLSGALSRYRLAVVRISAKLRSRAYDEELSAEVDDLWHQELAPVLVELEDLLAEHALVREIARAAGRDLRTLVMAGSALYVGLGQLANLEGWLTSAVAAAAPMMHAAAAGALSRAEVRREVGRHELFYVFELNRRLAGVR